MKIEAVKEKIKILINLADNAAATKGESLAARLRIQELIRKYNIEDVYSTSEKSTIESDSDIFNEQATIIRNEKLERRNILIRILDMIFDFPYILLHYTDDIIYIKISSNKDNFSDLLTSEKLDKLSEKLHTESIKTYFYENREMTNNRTRRLSYKRFFCGIEIKNFIVKEELDLDPNASQSTTTNSKAENFEQSEADRNGFN